MELYSKKEEIYFASTGWINTAALTDYLFFPNLNLNLYFLRKMQTMMYLRINDFFFSTLHFAPRKCILMHCIFFVVSSFSPVTVYLLTIINCKSCLCAGSFPDNARNLTSLGESYQTQARSCHSLWERRARYRYTTQGQQCIYLESMYATTERTAVTQ